MAVAQAIFSNETAEAADIVERFLVASMVPDPQTAARYISDELKITFTGGRKYTHPRETAAFNAKRYKWVKKKMERTDVVPGDGETIVYNLGTLYGEWPDGAPFEGNRYVDRFVVRGGKIAADGCVERQRRTAVEQETASKPDPPQRFALGRFRPLADNVRAVTTKNALEVAILLGLRNNQSAAGNRLEMVVHQRGGLRRVAFGKRRDDRTMFVDGTFRRSAAGCRAPASGRIAKHFR